MSRSYIPAQLRRTVRDHAGARCEYCLIDEDDTYFGCEVDHIISEKHGGETDAANLAYACALCNRAKGSDIGSVDVVTGTFTRFYHPRNDRWSVHFRAAGSEILGRTAIGRVTSEILRFNELGRRLERLELIERGRYPPPGAHP